MMTNDDDTPAGEIRAVAEGVYDELSQVIDKREATEGADDCFEESCIEPSNAVGDEEFLRQLAEMDNSVHSDMRPESTTPSCQPDTHEWFVFSTSLAQVWILVHCGVCRSIGTVKYPTTAEWDSACDAASKPYRWVDNSRVTILFLNLTDRNGNCVLQPHLAAMEAEPHETATELCRSSPNQHGTDRLAFWKWKATVIQRIFEHPAMQADAEPVIVPDFDGWHWEDDFNNGVTVDEFVDRANTEFNRGGW